MTRSEDLKQRVQDLMSRLQKHEKLWNQLRHSTDYGASMILARIRLGETISEIVDESEDAVVLDKDREERSANHPGKQIVHRGSCDEVPP
jgi:hypothetical protein